MNDIEIAYNSNMKNIKEIAESINIKDDDLILYGNYKAKVNKMGDKNNSKLVLVTSINPTPFGEGKTTVSIGLADGLHKLGTNVSLALREPSLGPVFGMKGGATGGGYSQVVPMDDINLHFNGDFSAIESANNLLAAAIDNHIEKGNSLGIDKVTFKRCLDVNDRSLRNIETSIGHTSFNITAASEIMAILCLAEDINDLKEKLSNIIVGYTKDGKTIYAKDLQVEGAMTVLLKDAIKPNLVQTLENTPAFIHGGPFANIAHGCNSIIATKTALSYSDIVITEAGFGSDLGAEKFFDIKCRKSGLKPDLVVVVATIKALKYNAGVGKDDILIPNTDMVKVGLSNLKIHVENMLKYNSNVIVAINKYDTDTDDEINVIKTYFNDVNIKCIVSSAYMLGGSGAMELANGVVDTLNTPNNFKLLYNDSDSIMDKINAVAKNIYRSGDVQYSDIAVQKISDIEKTKFSNLPICIAKTQYSLSDDSKLLNAPIGNILHVRDIEIFNGAGFITVYTGNIMTMPGLPTKPNYEQIDFVDDKVIGLS